MIAGIPFFYWYQLLWILIGAVIIAFVYRAGALSSACSTSPPSSSSSCCSASSPGSASSRRAGAAATWTCCTNGAWAAAASAHCVTWFLIGGDLYTAYTFIAVPALMFGAGAVGFFAVPYTVMVYPILYMVFPRLWSVAHKHGYVTSADFVRGRFGNRWLALAVAFTGILATMPYIALQLVGIQVVIGAMGVETGGLAGDLPLIIAFVILAAFTYTSGLRAPAMIAVVKDLLIYITVFAAIIAVPIHLGGYDKVFARDPARRSCCWRTPPAGSLRQLQRLCHAGTRLGLRAVPVSALDHRHPELVQRDAWCGATPPLLPAYSLMLGLLALVGFMAIAIGVQTMPEFADGFKHYRQQLRGAGAVPGDVPELVRRRGLRRDRHRRAGAGGDHVDRHRQHLHPQHLPRVHQSRLHRRAGKPDGEDRLAGDQGRRAGVHLRHCRCSTRSSCNCSAACGSSRRCRR